MFKSWDKLIYRKIVSEVKMVSAWFHLDRLRRVTRVLYVLLEPFEAIALFFFVFDCSGSNFHVTSSLVVHSGCRRKSIARES